MDHGVGTKLFDRQINTKEPQHHDIIERLGSDSSSSSSGELDDEVEDESGWRLLKRELRRGGRSG